MSSCVRLGEFREDCYVCAMKPRVNEKNCIMLKITTPQSDCYFGIAIGDMTPPIGIYHRMWGAARHDCATGVHQPLRATAVVFGKSSEIIEGTQLQVLVCLDHCLLGDEILNRILHVVETKTGVPQNQIVTVCSHTHAAGLLSLDRTHLPGGEYIPAYIDSLTEQIARLVARAHDSMEMATIVYGSGHCSLAANRDYWDINVERFVCGYNPSAEADDTVLVAKIENAQGQLLATFVNYACHPTTLAWDNTLISPDFPGTMRDTVEATTGAPCVFLQGASGELGPREGYVGDVQVAERNGKQLAHAVLSTLCELPSGATELTYSGLVESGAPIGTWSHTPASSAVIERAKKWSVWRGAIELAYRKELEPLQDIRNELERVETAETDAVAQGDDHARQLHRVLAERLRRKLAFQQTLPVGNHYPWQVAIWVLGDAIWLSVQGEPYSLLQTELRRRFADTPIIVASLGFSWSGGYIPAEGVYGKDLYQQNIAVVAPGSLERGIDRIAERIEALIR